MHKPTPDEPLFVLKIDEWTRAADPDRRDAIEKIESKCRSEGIALILATQRPENKWVATSIKANLTGILFAKMRAGDLGTRRRERENHPARHRRLRRQQRHLRRRRPPDL